MDKDFATKRNHRTFGGIIYPSDFDTEYGSPGNIAERIESDRKFDNQCLKNRKFTENRMKYQNEMRKQSAE